MNEFRDDFHWMQRERKGLFPWVADHPWRLLRQMRGPFCDHPFCRHGNENGIELVNHLLHNKSVDNELFDLFIKALIRAEVRFISRFVPQRSHEERLTGNLVSEIDAALFMIKDAFRESAVARYGVAKEIDFFYYDLSRGGRVEKQTGADLGFIVVVDLPDHPFTVRSIVLQAKKCDDRNPSIDLSQLRTLTKNWPHASGYLFYDMSVRRLVSPLVLETTDTLFSKLAEETEKTSQENASLDFNKIMDQGAPLSLYLFNQIVEKGNGAAHDNFAQAFDSFRRPCQQRPNEPDEFNGRLGIVSIGRSISIGVNSDGGLDVKV
ncbi:MAG: hypothetical protein HQ523_13020 [Lentisphaerae bacterium]|nr:hypothetical protein [Lentisphaerota bacterium]